jgi:CrcB protein
LGAVALGGALGAPARYEVIRLLPLAAHGFPWATFWTNVSGSFALGLFLTVVVRRYPAPVYLRAFVATGFLGAFTTFSTFAVEADLLVKDGRAGMALTYVALSLVAGVAAAAVGIALGRSRRLRSR